ncbi:hypothetical protein OQJ66_20440, partial [Aquimarina muelleri]|uniref:hypothetical protein n=1 Tax=Aquimarina muelleri TaxID=279356 RepID=UPI002249805F
IIIIALLCIGTINAQKHSKSNKYNFEEGIYATYYQSEKKSTSFKADYQVFYKNKTGFYWSTDLDTEFPILESYSWEIDDDVLMLNINKSIYLKGSKCKIVKNVIRHWKIINQNKNTIYLKLLHEELDDLVFDSNIDNEEFFIMIKISNPY